MKFYYLIKANEINDLSLKIPSPYITEEYATSLLQKFIKHHSSILALPNGNYTVNLYKDILPDPVKHELVCHFCKQNTSIVFYYPNH